MKLGLRAGQRVCLDDAPAGWRLTDPPVGLEPIEPPGSADLIIAFVSAESQLASRLPELARRIQPDGVLWVAWPRRAAGHPSDLTDTVIRDHALALGIVDVKVAAIDADWSGLKFVWRRANRGGS